MTVQPPARPTPDRVGIYKPGDIGRPYEPMPRVWVVTREDKQPGYDSVWTTFEMALARKVEIDEKAPDANAHVYETRLSEQWITPELRVKEYVEAVREAASGE